MKASLISDVPFASEYDRTETRRISSVAHSTHLSVSIAIERTVETHPWRSSRLREHPTGLVRDARGRQFYQRAKTTHGILGSDSQMAIDSGALAGTATDDYGEQEEHLLTNVVRV